MTYKNDIQHRLLLLTKSLQDSPVGGRELLCKFNYKALSAVYSGRLEVFELLSKPIDGVVAKLNAFRGHIDGLNTLSIETIICVIQQKRIERVFVDGSNLGGFVTVLKRRLPDVLVTTFFHNVEARFFWGALRSRLTPRSLAVLSTNYLAERGAVKHSDQLICMSERDSVLLGILYGRKATHIAPMVLEDKCPPSFWDAKKIIPERFAIFVGGAFYANREGISWFVREVVPLTDMPIFIIGRGFEEFRSELEVPGRVTVVGAVETLADWYQRAQFVIAPIFDGSGMKTKVAEALMYGKKIIGTSEAFSGYEEVLPQAGWVCETPDEFVAAIDEAQLGNPESFDLKLRHLYEQLYSMAAGTERLRQILS
jgi:glycosyltransferase involved in cell wall biosynthesis